MFQVNLSETANRKLLSHEGSYQVFEYERDLSVSPEQAIQAYYASEMNIRKRQVFITLNGTGVVVQAGQCNGWQGTSKHRRMSVVLATSLKRSSVHPLRKNLQSSHYTKDTDNWC